jgi:hypothetical protein
MITSLLKNGLAASLFKKRSERKPLQTLKHHKGVITSLFKKRLEQKP